MRIYIFSLLFYFLVLQSYGQVDTTYVYNNNTPYGSLDIRIAKSASTYYYLLEDKTFSFRQNAGVNTDAYFDMTSSWESFSYKQGQLREQNSNGNQFVMNYRLLPPQGYNTSYAKGYPLIIVFHGLGEAANCSERKCYHADKTWSPITNAPPAPTDSNSELLNNDHQLTNGGRIHLKAVNDAGTRLPDDAGLPARAFPGFVLFPQNLNGWDVGSVQDALRLVRLILKKYNIDKNRVYIHGLSNGGHGVYEALKRAPWMFAAALTMSAVDDAFVNNQGMAPAIAHIPLWVFQGGQDTNPYPQKTENIIKKFRDAGAVVRYTKYEDLGHGTWGTAYNEPDFFTWILGKNKANIHAFSGNAVICSGSGLKLELPAGYMAYQWQHNGTTISAATTSVYLATTPGTYRARFSRVANPTEAQWNRWSDPVEVKASPEVPQAEIIQHGTVLLNDPNNYTNASLEAKGEFSHYYWYKNGILIDFPGDQDDTIKVATITPSMGNGAYTLVTSNFDNCKSPASAAKNLFFNNSASVNINAPTNFAGIPAGTEINLTWQDASANEGGFEIWRRRKINESSFSPWEMATLTAANATTYKDTKLLPNTTYQYINRAVSSSGRSNYAPGGGGSLQLTTVNDTQPPTAPQNLAVENMGVLKLKLKWNPSTDNSAIRAYHIRFGTDSIITPTTDTTFVLAKLPVNKLFTFTVKAVDYQGNFSAASNAAEGNTYVSGLYYEHSTGVTFDLDSIDWSKPEFTGVVQTFTLAPKTQEEYYNFRFDGYLFITTAGNYQFRIGSDDGSRLKLNNNVLADNDGVHTFKIVESSSQNLTAGAHRIMVEYFEYTASDSLLVQFKGPDSNNEWADIPKTSLKSAENVITGIEDNAPEDNFIVNIFPNPSAQNNLSISVESAQDLPVNIQMIDMAGRIFIDHTAGRQQAREGIRLQPSESIRPGVYIISVKQGNTTSRQRVVITN